MQASSFKFPVRSGRVPLIMLAIALMAVAFVSAVAPQPAPLAAAGSVNWLRAEGNKIVNESGQTVVLRGVNIENREWVWNYGPNINFERKAIPEVTGDGPSGWGANVILLAIASGPVNRRDSTYLAYLDEMVQTAKSNGSYSLLVYRYSEPNGAQPNMPDQAGEDAMAALGKRYANEPAVIYGLQVEPHNVSWSQLKPRFTSMVDAIRAENPKSLIAVPGTNWGRYVHWALTDPIKRDNLIYKSHIYDPWSSIVSNFKLEEMAAKYPVILGEFGTGAQMTQGDVDALLDLSESLGISWVAWIFHNKACPCLLKDSTTLEPSSFGKAIKSRIQSAAPPAPVAAPTATPTTAPTVTPKPAPVATPTTALVPVINDLPISSGDVWRFFKGTQEPPANWNSNGFNDSSWAAGASGFGYGDGDDATVLADMQGRYTSVYLRHAFTVSDPSTIASLELSIDFDDGFVAYLNGTEVARSGLTGARPAFKALALNHEAGVAKTFDISALAGLLQPGQNVLAIQGHNAGISSSDFTLIPELSSQNFIPAPPVVPALTPTPTAIPSVQPTTVPTTQPAPNPAPQVISAPSAPQQPQPVAHQAPLVQTPMLRVMSAVVQAGSISSVPIRVDRLPQTGLAGFNIRVQYDPSVITALEVTPGDAPWTDNTVNIDRAKGVVTLVNAKASGAGGGDGFSIGYLKFKAEEGGRSTRLDVRALDAAGADLADIRLESFHGRVTVTPAPTAQLSITDIQDSEDGVSGIAVELIGIWDADGAPMSDSTNARYRVELDYPADQVEILGVVSSDLRVADSAVVDEQAGRLTFEFSPVSGNVDSPPKAFIRLRLNGTTTQSADFQLLMSRIEGGYIQSVATKSAGLDTTGLNLRRGDFMQDGEVDILDAVAALQFLAGNAPDPDSASKFSPTALASVVDSGESKANILDVIALMQHLAGTRDSAFTPQ